MKNLEEAMNRREALKTLSSAGSALILGAATSLAAAPTPARTRLGLVTYAFGIHQKNNWAGRHQGLTPGLALLEEANDLGAAGIQLDLGASAGDAAQATELRQRAEKYGMYVEASISPPKTTADVDRFTQAVRTAISSGAALARTVILPGRRYEDFKSLEEFRSAERAGLESLQRAVPILEKYKFRLAVENHKDQRIAEKLQTIKRVGSEYVGLCVDVGNSFTLLEDPLEVARAYAPHAFTVHFKDQAAREAPDGFWFADVPLGQGFLDLRSLIEILQAGKPDLHLNLEVITRDALNVPVLKSEFWVTMPDTPARDLARTLNTVKARAARTPFPLISGLSPAEQVAAELRNVRESFAFARTQLQLG